MVQITPMVTNHEAKHDIMSKQLAVLVAAIATLLLSITGAHAQTTTVKVTMDVIETYDFIELKCECDHPKGEQATGHITHSGPYTHTFVLGPKNGQNFWIWWDTLKGKANLTVEVDGVVVFKGECKGNAKGEVRLEDTSTDAVIKRDGAPRLEKCNDKPITYIRF